MNTQDILNMIQERIDSATRNEQRSTQAYLLATDDMGRERAVIGSQTSTTQRLILQDLLNEIKGESMKVVLTESWMLYDVTTLEAVRVDPGTYDAHREEVKVPQEPEPLTWIVLDELHAGASERSLCKLYLFATLPSEE